MRAAGRRRPGCCICPTSSRTGPTSRPRPTTRCTAPTNACRCSAHADERGPDAHPVLRAWQDEEVSRQLPARRGASRTVRPAYQGLIAQIDDHLGRVLDELERLGRWQDTLVVFTADHGDYLGDHWLGEKELFHDCVQRVPFIVYDPTAAADATRGTDGPAVRRGGRRRADHPRRARARPAPASGRGTVAAARRCAGTARARLARRASSASWTGPSAARGGGSAIRPAQHMAWMVRTDRWKYVHWTGGYRPQLFDLAARPARSSTTSAPTRRWTGCGTRCGTGCCLVHPAEVAHDDHLGRGRATHRQPQEGRRLPRRVVVPRRGIPPARLPTAAVCVQRERGTAVACCSQAQIHASGRSRPAAIRSRRPRRGPAPPHSP